MAQNDTDARYLASLQQGTFSKEERLKLAQGNTFEGIPTPPRTLARLCGDTELVVRVQAKKSILRLSEQGLVQIAADNETSPDVLLFLAKHFHDSPAVGTAIIGNKKTTEKVLYYLQGEIDENEEERESIFAADHSDREVEFEVEDIISSEKGRETGDDVEVTVELDNKPDSRGRFSERERYSDDDMEVVIGVESGQDEIIDEHLLERNIVDSHDVTGAGSGGGIESTGTAGADDRDFTSAVDAIEGKFDDVFQIERGQHDTVQGSQSPAGFGIGGAAARTTPGASADQTRGMRGTEPGEPGTSGQQQWGGPARVVMNEARKEVAVDTGKFVARLPMGRYFYKVSPLEIITRIVRISVPIIAVLVILTVFWFTMPTSHPPVEELEGGVNRVFYSIKKDGLNPKIPDPFSVGSVITSWEFVKSSPETEVTRGGLKKVLGTFSTNFSEEIEYDNTKSELIQRERTYKTNRERIAEIDETVTTLNADKTKYLSLLSNNKLDAQSIEEEYQKEVKIFKDDFSSLESQIKIIERDTADAKRRIAEYESIYGPGGNDPGYIANKMELGDLTAEYAKLKPPYDKRKAVYESRLRAIREQYQNMLDDTVWLQTVDTHIGELQQEKIRLSSENKIIEKESEALKGKVKTLEIERSKRPKLTGETLIMFLVLSHYIHEKGVRKLDEISLFDRYRIYKTVSDVDVGLTAKGTEKQKRYVLTFMRLETEKSIILFRWNKDSTTWVLTSITAGK
jgi:hypothetical protein